MAIIMRLDRVMADRKISLNELSERVGVANVNLSKMKTGKISAIRFTTLDAICDVLDCQPGDILEHERQTVLADKLEARAEKVAEKTEDVSPPSSS
ncbi:MAG: helix-turn-helix transcriptional regulator [Coriobacteriia bacterium]|jgi:putative transcriptional regulator|nr:helix-turn-helix transcriptional regulator [Coriobacteriia bacterium]MDR2714639.1 helix-turn-helix transcriptional regulator [Coriobacteriales bacterium]